jgi:hypothetical protein
MNQHSELRALIKHIVIDDTRGTLELLFSDAKTFHFAGSLCEQTFSDLLTACKWNGLPKMEELTLCINRDSEHLLKSINFPGTLKILNLVGGDELKLLHALRAF